MAAQMVGASSSAGFWRYVAIGFAAAASGTLLKWIQGFGETNVLITSFAYLVITLLPAVLTYIFQARDQERKLGEVVSSLDQAKIQLSELRRAFEVEKNYYANERLLNVERRVIEETGSSMQEVAELVSAFGDNDVAHVKLKERFRLHAKSIITFDRAFQFEVEQNFKNISQIENEFVQIPHDQRDEIIYESGRYRTERLAERYQLGSVVDGIKVLTDRSVEIKLLAATTHEGVIKTLDADDSARGGV